MPSSLYHAASAHQVERLTRALVASGLFADEAELRARVAAEPWRVQVSARQDVAVLDRWREHLPVLSLEALWCPLRRVPAAATQMRQIAETQGLADVVSPPVPLEDAHHWERAGMHAHTVLATLALGTLKEYRPRSVPAGLTLRTGTAADVARILQLESASFDNFWRYDRPHVERLLRSGHLMLAEHGGALVGYAHCAADSGGGLLGRLAVEPEWRRRGVGRALVDDAVRYTQLQRGTRVWLSTQHDNTASHALYRAAGFEDTGRRHAFMRFVGEDSR